MPCVFPIDAWRAAQCNDSGKRSVVFNRRDGYSDMPLQIPCGKCVGCARDRAVVWGIRMYHEASMHEQNCFLTLTYKNAPPCLSKRDLQLFFKRLRRSNRLRFFACGELGERTKRPHYHAIVFGQDFLGGSAPINEELYTNPVLESIWGHGFVSIGRVTIESCMYVAGYTQKKLNDPNTFNLMSRNPGIGKGFLEAHRESIIRTEKVVIQGNQYAIPKRYIEWYEEEFDKVKQKRRGFFQHETPDEAYNRRKALPAREVNYKAKLALAAGTL